VSHCVEQTELYEPVGPSMLLLAHPHSISLSLPHAVNCGRFCFWRRQSVFFLFVYEISREPLNGFAPNSHGRRVWSVARTSLKVTVKGQGQQGQNGIFRPLRRPACMRFMFGKTYLAFSDFCVVVAGSQQGCHALLSCTLTRGDTLRVAARQRATRQKWGRKLYSIAARL